MPTPSNIILIGMPGSGKSTVGVILAKLTARDFVDTDVIIQTSRQRKLQDIVDTEGHLALRAVEAAVILDLRVHNHVIATGGSAVYSGPAMAHLKNDGVAVFLEVGCAELLSRLGDFSRRGIAKRPDQRFQDIYEERMRLYRQYADITIDCSGRTQEGVCLEIIKRVFDNAVRRASPFFEKG